MALERDNQHIEAVYYCGVESIAEAALTFGRVDTKGMRSLTFAILESPALDPLDVAGITVEESADDANWTTLAAYKMLPSELQEDPMPLLIPDNGYLQTVGVVSSERYVRLIITFTHVEGGQRQTIKVLAIMHPEQLAFKQWYPEAYIGDGEP